MPSNSNSQRGKSNSTAKSSAKKGVQSSGGKRTRRTRKAGRASYITALIFLFLGIFLAIGYINNDGAFIKFLCNFVKGLVGFGYYFMPPALIIASIIIAFSKKKTAVFRAVCILLIPFFAGSIFHLIKGSKILDMPYSFKLLWDTGVIVNSGGVLSGSFTKLLTFLLSKIGAWIIMIVLTGLDLFFASGIPIAAVLGTSKKSKKAKSNKEEFYQGFKDELMYGDKSFDDINDEVSPQDTTSKQAGKKEFSSDAAIKAQIDIPVDPPINEKKTKKLPSFFNKKRGVATPAEFVTGKVPEVPEEEIEEVINTEEVPGFPREDENAIDAVLEEEKKDPEPKNEALPEENSGSEQQMEEESFASEVAKTTGTEAKKVEPEYVFPPLSLLASSPGGPNGDSREEVRMNTQRLENALRSFGVNAEISNVVRGPSVTRYEMELEVGVKLNKLTNLSDDIALALGATGVRIAAIPNKISTVGIEVPNKKVNTVYLRDIIDSSAFKNSDSKLTFAIGENISGEAIVSNIAKLPHLLVAGTTGSGKSVCLNSLILSILYKARPDEVKFIMIDPKMVEFKVYNGIPHLLVPVVTEAKKASGALQWAVTEMMKRYRLFSETGARDLASYNNLMAKEDGERMPQIVVIIDELADLMLVAAKEVEESICRIAQMGRAAGIHLVIATQSPRADVITGLMKANIPSRIAFKVASALESRIILDAGGNADKLVGNGDMLFAPIGTSRPYRIQGAWVTDDERESIVGFIKKSGTAEYSESIMNEMERVTEDKKAKAESQASKPEESDTDALFPQAVEIVLDMGQASVSMLQRRLKLGYSRAARLVDQMEEKGIVGPFEGSKPRQVLITKQQWQEMQFITGTAPIPEKPDLEPGQTMESADDLFDD